MSLLSVKAVYEGTVGALVEAVEGTQTLAKALSAKKKALNRYFDDFG